jgi:RHS repeat-associated protein
MKFSHTPLIGLLVCASAWSQAQTLTWTYEYDAEGHVTKITDPRGQNQDLVYDNLYRNTQQTLPAPTTGAARPVIGKSFDLQDQAAGVVDPRNLSTTYTADGLGNLNQQSSPDTGLTVFTYDAAGNWLTKKDARNVTTSATYDRLNRITKQVYSGTGFTTQTDTFVYDQGSNAAGKLSSTTFGGGATSWTYDAAARISAVTQRVGSTTLSSKWQYSASGQLQSQVLPSGKTLSYTYNAAGQVSKVSLDGVVLVQDIGYYPLSETPVSWTWGNGRSYSRQINTLGQITQYPLGDTSRTLVYDAAGRITSMSHTKAGVAQAALNESYGYDNLDRLTSNLQATTTRGISYDATGNRTATTLNGVVSSYTTAPTSNKLMSIGAPQNKTYTYDAAGNLTSDGSKTYTYDARGRLSKVTQGTLVTTYTYDSTGQRIQKSNAQGTVISVYAQPGQLLGEYSSTGQAQQEVVWLGDMPLAILTSEEIVRDNTQTGTGTNTSYTGTWGTATTPYGYYGTNYRTAAKDTSTNPAKATWRPNAPAGTYKVYARWPGNTTHSAKASYTITHSTGQTSVSVDQRQDASQWAYLGSFALANTSTITLTAQNDGIVAADAIKVVNSNEASRINYVYSDHLGTPRVITNTANQERWRWLGEPFGTAAPEENPAGLGAFKTSLRLPGQLFDQESALHYNTYRDYDPATGRYIQSDPIGLAGGD